MWDGRKRQQCRQTFLLGISATQASDEIYFGRSMMSCLAGVIDYTASRSVLIIIISTKQALNACECNV